jgi:V/A-type H+/Na+-transporting ATPase subunit C
MPTGVTGYAAINSRVRVMYSTLLSEQDFAHLYEAPDLSALVTLLKHSAYGPYLEKVKDKDLSPRRAAFQIRQRLADAYTSILHTAPEHSRELLLKRYRYFEVDNLKAVLRGIVTGASWDRVSFVLFPFGSASSLPAQEMVEAGNVTAAVEVLRGSPYYETLSFAMKRYSTEQNIFPLEVALDLNYWREVWKEVNRLPSEDRNHAQRVIGTMLDMNNMMWAIRYRVYHNLSEEELINYTLSIGYHMRDEYIRAIAAGADLAHTIKRAYPDLPNVDALLETPRDGLPALEIELLRRLAEKCRAEFVGNPFHIGIPLAYLTLNELEIQDLVVLVEAKSNNVPLEGFRQYLVMGSPVKV